MDTNSLGMVRSGKPMLSQQQTQPVPNRFPLTSYYSQPGPMPPYPQQPQIPSVPHRSLSQNTTPNYSSIPTTTIPSNGIMNKSNLVDSIDMKSDDSFDDPSKLQVSQLQQQPQQQQMFQPLLQSRSRPQTPSYYSNMPPTNNTYYSPQRPLTPSSSDYTMSVGRGIRGQSVPPNAYGTLPVQQRGYISSSTNDLSGGINNNNNTMGVQSTPPPSSLPPSSIAPH